MKQNKQHAIHKHKTTYNKTNTLTDGAHNQQSTKTNSLAFQARGQNPNQGPARVLFRRRLYVLYAYMYVCMFEYMDISHHVCNSKDVVASQCKIASVHICSTRSSLSCLSAPPTMCIHRACRDALIRMSKRTYNCDTE